MREALRRAASNRWDEMTPEQAVEEVSPVLRAGAEAVAESLATGKPLKDTRLAVPLEQAFLAESPDASEEAQARCRAIREAFAEELEMAVKADAAAQAQKLIFEELSEVDTRPVLRVEVRGTAGRSLIDRAVAVGSKPECDVQVFGDEGVRPLQFLVVSLYLHGHRRFQWRDLCHMAQQHATARTQRSGCTRRDIYDCARGKSRPASGSQLCGAWTTCIESQSSEESCSNLWRGLQRGFPSQEC